MNKGITAISLQSVLDEALVRHFECVCACNAVNVCKRVFICASEHLKNNGTYANVSLTYSMGMSIPLDIEVPAAQQAIAK